MKYQSLFLTFITLSLVACTGADAPVDTNEDAVPAPTPTPEAKVVDPGLQNAINFYSATVCMVADPNFWEGFMGEAEENGWVVVEEGEEPPEDPEYQAFLRSFGYSSEEEAKAATEKYVGLSKFVEGVTMEVETRCPGLVGPDDMKMIIDSMKEM